jgi:hypothetical protein
MQLKGSLSGRAVTILVDSRSSHSFLSSTIAAGMPNLTKLSAPVSVRVADGGSLVCSAEIHCAEWSVQGYSFHSTQRVLQLGSYDMIIGMDWLEAFSPMKVDWRDKWMQIPYGLDHISLRGLLPDSGQSALTQLCHITSSVCADESADVPLAVQQLIDEFTDLFQEPTELPPCHPCDHHIPLVPGAPPVAVRQYRYKPALKDEIEK